MRTTAAADLLDQRQHQQDGRSGRKRKQQLLADAEAAPMRRYAVLDHCFTRPNKLG